MPPKFKGSSVHTLKSRIVDSALVPLCHNVVVRYKVLPACGLFFTVSIIFCPTSKTIPLRIAIETVATFVSFFNINMYLSGYQTKSLTSDKSSSLSPYLSRDFIGVQLLDFIFKPSRQNGITSLMTMTKIPWHDTSCQKILRSKRTTSRIATTCGAGDLRP